MCYDFLYKIHLKKLLVLRRTDGDNTINVLRFSCKVSVIVRFSAKLNVLDKFSKSTQIRNFIKIGPGEPSCSVRTDGTTDTTKLTVAFRNFAKSA